MDWLLNAQRLLFWALPVGEAYIDMICAELFRHLTASHVTQALMSSVVTNTALTTILACAGKSVRMQTALEQGN